MKNRTYVKQHARAHKENAITKALLKREEMRGAKIEHKEHPEFSKKIAERIAKDHLKKDKYYYLKESGKLTAKKYEKKAVKFAKKEAKQAGKYAQKEWTTFKDFLKRKKQEREAQKALKEEVGTKLETY